MECGHPLGSTGDKIAAPEPARIFHEAERRQLTVMFCDLVGSTALSGGLDPEELREVVRAYQRASAEVIERYEGHIAQYLGDGLLVYFGFPKAHEDDPLRAVHAGLGIIEKMRGLNERLEPEKGILLAVRIGIHTGPVVVGEMGDARRQENLAMGETPNVAARFQGLADPDAVVISASTHRLVQGFFEFRDMGEHSLKGVFEPMTAYHVTGVIEGLSRLHAGRSAGLTPLVGRETEAALLREGWEQLNGGGHVGLLSGEAGIGKSRLVEFLKVQAAENTAEIVECSCSPYHQNSALHPMIELLQRRLGFDKGDSPEQKLSKLEAFVNERGIDPAETVPPLASLVSVPLGAGYAGPGLSPQELKQKTFDALLAWLVSLSAERPVLFVMEDMHWVDPSMLELLGLLVEERESSPIYSLFTFRPTFEPPWESSERVTRLTLGHLDREQVFSLVQQVARGKQLPAEVVERLAAQTDGVPLYVEELTKMLLESDLLEEGEDRYRLTGPLPDLEIPETLQDSLMARLDRLDGAKEVAQMGAAIGRSFSFELIEALSPLSGETMERELGRLVDAELLYQERNPSQAVYTFKHALIQEAAYQSLLRSTRQQYHHRIAEILENHFPDTAETEPEILARHYSEAGDVQQATDYWEKAGRRAAERSANVETVSHFKKAIEQLELQEATPARDKRELGIQISLGPALMSTLGIASPEVEKTYFRARELCRDVGDPSEHFISFWGIWLSYQQRGDLKTAGEMTAEVLALAEDGGDPEFRLQSYHAGWTTEYCTADFASCWDHIEKGVAIYDVEKHRAHHLLYGGHDPGVCGLNTGALTLWFLGYPDRAMKMSHEAIAMAEELEQPFSLVLAHYFLAQLHQFRQEPELARERAELMMDICNQFGIQHFDSAKDVLVGWADSAQGRRDVGIPAMQAGLDLWRASGAKLRGPDYIAVLAEAYGRNGDRAEGLRLVEEAIGFIAETGECRWEAEVFRLKGELLSELKDTHSAAEDCFRAAIDAARRQSAKSLELRAVMSLGRLRQSQGKKDEARELLGGVYGWFTEGFDTKDLIDAKALLDELS
jgi:class 3 adenylate cyclase/predicted ATPase